MIVGLRRCIFFEVIFGDECDVFIEIVVDEVDGNIEPFHHLTGFLYTALIISVTDQFIRIIHDTHTCKGLFNELG